MDQPVIAQKSPYAANVEEGNSYWWCACGRSKSQPFCDGSHKGTSFSPVEYKADRTGTVFFCGCKRTSTPTMCDGTHSTLK
jgi:CDGSH-type Zn-finger protein